MHAPLSKPDALARGHTQQFGTLVTILAHEMLDDGRIVIECVAGPRCALTQWHVEEVEGGLPLSHVEISLAIHDEPSSSRKEDEALARRCLTLLQVPDGPSVLEQAAVMPPLFDVERLSFFLCNLLLPSDDTSRRLQFLYGTSTNERLVYCVDALEKWAARKATIKAMSAPQDSTSRP